MKFTHSNNIHFENFLAFPTFELKVGVSVSQVGGDPDRDPFLPVPADGSIILVPEYGSR